MVHPGDYPSEIVGMLIHLSEFRIELTGEEAG
jgi:hypothetical protein